MRNWSQRFPNWPRRRWGWEPGTAVWHHPSQPLLLAHVAPQSSKSSLTFRAVADPSLILNPVQHLAQTGLGMFVKFYGNFPSGSWGPKRASEQKTSQSPGYSKSSSRCSVSVAPATLGAEKRELWFHCWVQRRMRRRKRCVHCGCVHRVCVSIPVRAMPPAMRQPVCQGLWGQPSPAFVNPFNPLTHRLLLVLPGAGVCSSWLVSA